MVLQHTKEYALAKSKDEKSTIVTSIAAEVRRRSPQGGFVKKDSQGWYEVGEFLAREKVSQCFRDQLHSRYKSSTTTRRKNRQERRKSIGSSGTTTTPPTSSSATRDQQQQERTRALPRQTVVAEAGQADFGTGEH
jgi:hypothetical protein